MTSAATFDAGPLSWVKGEIDLALERVVTGLQQFGANTADLTQIKFCRNHLHQVRGALTIVGLDGVTQFTDAVEALLTDLEAGRQPADSPRIALIGRAVSSIRRYLDDLIAGDPNQPLRLLDLYRQIAAARGQAAPSASELFFPDLSSRPQLPHIALAENGQAQLKAARARYQKGLLAFIKAPTTPIGALELKLAAQMAASADASPALRGFWWVAGGFFSALSEKSIAADAETKALCARIDQQLRQQADGSRAVPEKLMRDALFQVAIARGSNADIQAIKDAYALASLIPSAETRTVSQAAQLEPFLKRLKEIANASEDAWNKFCTGNSLALQTFCDAAAALDQGAERLGHTDFRRLIRAVGSTANWIKEDRSRHNDVVSLEMATGVLLIGNGVDNFTRLGPDFVHQVDVMVARLHACIAETPIPHNDEVPVLDEMTRRAQEKLLVAQVVKEIQSSLGQIEQALDTYFREPDEKSQLAGCHKPMSQIIGALAILGHMDAVIQLQDGARRIKRFQEPDYQPDQQDFELIARQLSALGFFVEALQAGVTDYSAFIAGLEAKPSKVEAAQAIAIESAPPADVPRTDGPDAAIEPAMASPETAQAAPVTAAPEPAAEVAPQTPVAETPEIDAELLEIFLEEGNEVITTIGEQLDTLRTHPSDTEALTTLRRAFHTLKGSSRMVGLMEFGDVAWVVEQVHNLWLRQEKPVDAAFLGLVETSHQVFSAWIGHLEGNGQGRPDTAALIALGEQLKGGETITAPGRPSAAPTPAPILEIEEADDTGEEITLESVPEVSFDLDLPDLTVSEPFGEAFSTSMAPLEADASGTAIDEAPLQLAALEEVADDASSPDESLQDFAIDVPIQSAPIEALPAGEIEPDQPPPVQDLGGAALESFADEDVSSINLTSLIEPVNVAEERAIADAEPDFSSVEGSSPASVASSFAPSVESVADLASGLAPFADAPQLDEVTEALSLDLSEPEGDAAGELAAETIDIGDATDLDLSLDVAEPAGEEATAPELLTGDDADAEIATSELGLADSGPQDDELAVFAPELEAVEPETSAEDSASAFVAESATEAAAEADGIATVEAITEPAPEVLAELALDAVQNAPAETSIESAQEYPLAAPDEMAQEAATETSLEAVEDESSEATDEIASEVADAAAEDAVAETPTDTLGEYVTLAEPAKPEHYSGQKIVIAPTLYQIFLEEAHIHIATLQRGFGELEISPASPTPLEMLRAAHTIGSISGTVGFQNALLLGHGIEAALLRRQKSANPASLEALETLRIAIAELEGMVAAIERSETLSSAAVLISQIDELYPCVAAETIEAAASTLSGMSPQERDPELDGPLPDDDLDESLLPIFQAEAADLVVGINERLAKWSANPYDTDTIHALSRLLHTLKGSARMAGAKRVGVLTHRLESSIESAHRAGGADPTLIAALQADFDDIAEVAERLEAHPAVVAPEPEASNPESPVSVDFGPTEDALVLEDVEPLPELALDLPDARPLAEIPPAAPECADDASSEASEAITDSIALTAAEGIDPLTVALESPDSDPASEPFEAESIGADSLEAVLPEVEAPDVEPVAATSLDDIAPEPEIVELDTPEAEAPAPESLDSFAEVALSIPDEAPASALPELEVLAADEALDLVLSDEGDVTDLLLDFDEAPVAPVFEAQATELPEPTPSFADVAPPAFSVAFDAPSEPVLDLDLGTLPDNLQSFSSRATFAPEPALEARTEALPEDHLDPDLLPIFLEEAVEIVRTVYQQLDAWQAAPTDSAATHGLARSLHTLKGSARMAGAMSLGALTHTLESRAEEAAKSGHASVALIEQMKHAFDAIAQIVERLQAGETLAEMTIELPAAAASSLTPPAMAPAPLASPPVEEASAPVAPVVEPVPAAPAKIAPRPLAPALPAAVTAPAAPAAVAAAVAAQRKDSDASKAMLRVPAGLIDNLVNDAGELSIARARIEGEMRSLKQSLLDLTENVIRLRRQLREIEIQAESQMQSRIAVSTDGAPDFDPLELDRFTRFQEVTRMMAESVNDVATVQLNLLKNVDEANAGLAAQARLNRELQQSLMSVRMVPFSSITERLYRIVRQTAKELGKRADLEVKGASLELDQNVINKMIGPLEHLLRNAISHGIEMPDIRAGQGKEDIGEIGLTLRQEGNEVIITMRDDGAGLNFSRIREKAVAKGLMSADEAYDERRLTEMIFNSGFSTATQVSQIAGRGVGMDVVMTEVTNLGGRIDVTSESGKGSTFRIYLPLTLAVTNAVIVRIGSRFYAIPAAMVDQVREVKPAVLAELQAGGGTEWQGNFYPFHFLPHLLGEPGALPEARRMYWVLYLHSGLQRVAVQVDELQSTHEIVVKNIGPQLARVVGIAGATVMGDGRVILILNPVALAARVQATAVSAGIAATAAAEALAAGGEAPLVVAPAEPEKAIHLPTVLVVDDSLTVRKITSRLLAREGYQVMTAKDGQDALEQMVEVLPDVILSDIEMPRMDGFELARNLRNDPRLNTIPVVMISSRTAEKHRSHAAELGVHHFLGKPYQEDELLGLIAGFIAEQRAAA